MFFLDVWAPIIWLKSKHKFKNIYTQLPIMLSLWQEEVVFQLTQVITKAFEANTQKEY